jgi:pimeloyl-ACP methyl ester carboxylesterase
MEKPVQFQSGQEQLCGILHLPEEAQKKRPELGFVFVHSGSRGRRGNTFQYPMYARYFYKMGYPSFRFDPSGIADSTGRIDTCKVEAFYGAIQVGRYVPDTIAGVQEFYRHVQPEKLILFGICGGAITALLAAPRIPEIEVPGLVLLSIPVLIDSPQQSELARIPTHYAREYLISMYARKLLSLKAWKRLLSGKSEVDTIWTMLKASVFGHGKKSSASPEKQEGKGPRFNPHFLEAFEEMVNRKSRMIFLFGDDDTFRWEFERDFYNNFWHKRPEYEQQCEVHYIAGCNHMFTYKEWQRQALDFVTPWLQHV